VTHSSQGWRRAVGMVGLPLGALLWGWVLPLSPSTQVVVGAGPLAVLSLVMHLVFVAVVVLVASAEPRGGPAAESGM
jgi:hypothetical protein